MIVPVFEISATGEYEPYSPITSRATARPFWLVTVMSPLFENFEALRIAPTAAEVPVTVKCPELAKTAPSEGTTPAATSPVTLNVPVLVKLTLPEFARPKAWPVAETSQEPSFSTLDVLSEPNASAPAPVAWTCRRPPAATLM